MANFVQIFSEKMRPYGRTLLIIALVILFSVVSYFLYYRVFKPQLKTTEKGYDDIANRDKNLANTCEILFFNASWCPWCAKAAPEWSKFSDEYNGKSVNGHKILCKNIDCTDSDDENANALLQKHQVEGYPTIKAILDDKVISFDAKVTRENLETFVNQL